MNRTVEAAAAGKCLTVAELRALVAELEGAPADAAVLGTLTWGGKVKRLAVRWQS